MPVGVIVNCLAISLGGLIGALARERIPEKIKQNLPVIFSVCAMALGITLIVGVKNLPPVVLALILGTAIGEVLDIEEKLHGLTEKLQNKLEKGRAKSDEKAVEGFITLLVLFSMSAGFIIGSLHEGMTGDTTLLVIKSILDFFTAMIFATTIGYLVMLISIPALIIGTAFFALAFLILPYLNEALIADFTAGGGIINLLVGIRMMELKKVPVANSIPAIVLFIPLSYLWTLIF
jgi:uncharacterized membrane protein YqgA involved in biofilm formation